MFVQKLQWKLYKGWRKKQNESIAEKGFVLLEGRAFADFGFWFEAVLLKFYVFQMTFGEEFLICS